jgi:hypothetical protein
MWLAMMVPVLVNYTLPKKDCNHFSLTKISHLAMGCPRGGTEEEAYLFVFNESKKRYARYTARSRC